MRQDPVLFYDFSLSRLAVISKGIRCSPTDFLMKMLIAVDMLMPMESQNVSNSFFTSVSMRIQIVVCAMVYSYPDLHIAKSFYFIFFGKASNSASRRITHFATTWQVGDDNIENYPPRWTFSSICPLSIVKPYWHSPLFKNVLCISFITKVSFPIIFILYKQQVS